MHQTSPFLHKMPDAPLRILYAGTYEGSEGEHFPWHHHDMWEMVYYAQGVVESDIGDTAYIVGPGTALITPPGIAHRDFGRTAYTNLYIQIETAGNPLWPRVYHDDAQQSLARVCQAIVHEWEATLPQQNEMVYGLTLQLAVLLHRFQTQPVLTANERLVQAAEAVAEARYTAPLTVADIAHEVGVSPSHLRAQFVRLRNQTPLAYLHSVRSRRALELIRHSRLSLEAIAHLCGYDSASHLSRHIKRTYGQTPGYFRHDDTLTDN